MRARVRHDPHLLVLLAFLVLAARSVAEEVRGVPRVAARGRWLLDSEGKPTPPAGITRGLQPSGLAFRRGELWAVGDQRSAYPGHLLRIDPKTARLVGKPLRLELASESWEGPPEEATGSAAPGTGAADNEATGKAASGREAAQKKRGAKGDPEDLESYRAIPNSDFEALCVHPKDPETFLAITEDKIPWIVGIRLEGAGARVVSLTRISLPPSVTSWRDDTNFRFEGICVSDDFRTVYLGFERAKDNLPRICRLSLEAATSGTQVTPEVIPIAFDRVPHRPDKEKALLNLNDMQFLRYEGRPALVILLRDQERVALVDLERGAVVRVVDLDLTDPEGAAIEWVSPEGLAFDPEGDRLWLVNDPDSMRANYRLRACEQPEGQFANYTPVLYDLRLSEVLGRPSR